MATRPMAQVATPPRHSYPSYEEITSLVTDPSRHVELDQLLADYGVKDLSATLSALPSPYEVFDQAEANSYGVRCNECGQWETACSCEVDA